MRTIRTTRRQSLCIAMAAVGMGVIQSSGTHFGITDSNQAIAESPPASSAKLSSAKPVTSTPEMGSSRVFQLPPVDSNVRQVVVTAMAADPKGEFLAVAGDDHVIRILDSETMRIVKVLGREASQTQGKLGHFDWIRTLAFDRGGSRLSSAGHDGRLIIWDRRRNFELMQEIDSAPALACVRFSPAGKQMAAVGFDSQVFLIGTSTNQSLKLPCDCIDLRCCCYHDDNSTLAVAGRDGNLHLFDPTSGASLHEQNIHDARIRDMAYMPESSILISVSENGEIVRYDSHRRQILSRRKITTGRLFSLAIINSHTIATAGSDDEIYLVTVGEDGQELAVAGTLRGHAGSVSTLVVCNGALISGGYDATFRRWQLPSLSTPQDKIALKSKSGGEADSER